MENQIPDKTLYQRNGDRVIKLTTSAKFNKKHSGLNDLATVTDIFKYDQDTYHLGMIQTFDSLGTLFLGRTNVIPKMMTDMIAKRAILNLPDQQMSFTYSTPITRYDGLKIMRDTTVDDCEGNDKPGFAGSMFPVWLNKALRPNDIFTYDVYYGIQMIVSPMADIEPEGDTFKHMCTLAYDNADTWMPFDKLKAGTEMFKIGNHIGGEFGEQYSEFLEETQVDEFMQKFVLVNHISVETAATLYGGEKSLSTTAASMRLFDKILNDVEVLRTSTQQPYDILQVYENISPASTENGRPKFNFEGRKSTVMSLFEAMAVAELIRMEATSLLFLRGGVLTGTNGTAQVNEGLYWQFRRGNIFTYPRPYGTDLAFWQRFSDSLFRQNPDVKDQDRFIDITGGSELGKNIEYIIQNHAQSILGQPALQTLIGADRLLPTSPLSGSLDNLKLAEVKITDVYLTGVGRLRFTHDPSLDYTGGQDRMSKGAFGSTMKARTTFMGWVDARNSNTSNAMPNVTVSNNAQFADEDAKRLGSLFYVKPTRSLHWGWENGRMNSVSNLMEEMSHMSSHRAMSTQFWMHARSAAWILDKSAIYIVELETPRVAKIRI